MLIDKCGFQSCFMRSRRSSPNPEEGAAGALDFSSIACSPLLCFRALSRRLLAWVGLSSGLVSGPRFSVASKEDVVCNVAFAVLPLLLVLDLRKGVSSKRWQARHLTRTYFSAIGERLPLGCFLNPGFGLAVFDACLSALLICDVRPGTRIVPHALQDEFDPSLLLDIALPAISICRWSISCAEVAGTVAEYRCPDAYRNFSLSSAASSAMLRMAFLT